MRDLCSRQECAWCSDLSVGDTVYYTYVTRIGARYARALAGAWFKDVLLVVLLVNLLLKVCTALLKYDLFSVAKRNQSKWQLFAVF